MSYRIPFSGRAHAYTAAEVTAVTEAMQHAAPLTQGPHRDAFEAAARHYTGSPHAFACCNATAALEMAAQLCRFKPGEEIVCPSHTFTASVYPFVKQGATVVWADIDPATRVVTAETLAARVTPRTKAVMAVHLYGYVADMPAIRAMASEKGLLVIEDSAQTIGAFLDGRHSGTFGDFGVISLHSHKNVSTLGEGGLLLVRDPEMAAVVPMLRHNGHCPFPYEREDYWIPAMGNVDLPELHGERLMPNNFCLGEVECALGVELLKRVDAINAEKHARAMAFIDDLAHHPELDFLREDSPRHNYHLLVARLGDGPKGPMRDAFIRAMARDKGVQCVVQYCPLNRYDFYRKLGYGQADCPAADDFFDNMVSFPFHHSLSEADLAYVRQSADEVLKELKAA